MKKIKVMIGTGMIFLSIMGISGMTYKSSAATLKEIPAELQAIDKPFAELEDDDLVIKMPGGGYLHGKAELTKRDDPKRRVIASYDSKTDSNTITVAQAREEMLADAAKKARELPRQSFDLEEKVKDLKAESKVKAVKAQPTSSFLNFVLDRF